MADDDLDLLDFDLDPLQNKETQRASAPAVKFKPKHLKPKPSLPKPLLNPPPPPPHNDNDNDSHLPYSLSPHSTTTGTSHPKSKLQPQRKKLSAAPASHSHTNTTQIPDHQTDPPTTLSEIDLLHDVSLEPLASNAQPTIQFQPKENGSKGEGTKLIFSVPEAYGTESLHTLINQSPITSQEIQVNNASEPGVEHTQNDEQGQSFDMRTEKEKEDALNLDEVFNFFQMDEANEDPILEMDEASDDCADENHTGEGENQGREEQEVQTDGKKPSTGRKTNTTDSDANIGEGSPKKKDKLSHLIRRKRRKAGPKPGKRRRVVIGLASQRKIIVDLMEMNPLWVSFLAYPNLFGTKGFEEEEEEVGTVDPALLEMPENEINPRQISIRNLILLVEAKEKKWNREAALRSSNGDTSSMPRRREQDEYFFNSEAHEEKTSEQVSAPQETFQPTIKKLNYHTYMNRSSSSRWTQSDTELFYKGIRQFGIDFAMIQQLFPNRTRHQIKLKFKSEDKKHRTRVRDAITHRLTDNSQFEKVIEILEIEADKVALEDSKPSQAAHWKNEEAEGEAEENFETSHSNVDNSGKHEPVPNDGLDAIFNWDNQDMEEEMF